MGARHLFAMRGRKRAAEEGDGAREGGGNACEGTSSARVARARDDGDARGGEDAVEEDVVKVRRSRGASVALSSVFFLRVFACVRAYD